MTAPRTARARARAELTREIKDAARRQLAVDGAQGLSLRAVSRELGMVSSALYRYFPSRDHLLTALIVDAYDAIGEAAERAVIEEPDRPRRERWLAIWRATRAWALAHPHEYALIYGSPVPGYRAPQDTIVPASRVARALLDTLSAPGTLPASDTRPAEVSDGPEPADPQLVAQGVALVEALGVDVAPTRILRLITAWTQLFGTINFELFGQYVGSVDPSERYFEYVAERMADHVGL